MKYLAYILLYLCYINAFASKKDLYTKYNQIKGYNGTVNKISNVVNIFPNITFKMAKNSKLCNIILTSFNGNDIPFVAEIESSELGIGKMVVSGPIRQDNYHFTIKAKLCDTDIFTRELPVDIEVISESIIIWNKSKYRKDIKDDLRPGSKVIQVHAKKIGDSLGDSICNYKMKQSDGPFDIDGNGVVRTTNRLNALIKGHYALRIDAIDCLSKEFKSSEVKLDIFVTHVCKFGWNGLYKQINYQPNKGLRLLGRNISFDSCNSHLYELCKPTDVSAKLHLLNADTKRCDLDLASLRHQRRMCNVAYQTQELLPSPDQFNRESHGSGGSADSSTGVFSFDGTSTQWEVPTNIVPGEHSLGANFTLSFWMRHNSMHQARKQQILCNSDGNYKNRHHYSVFMHNCKLIILLRLEHDLFNGDIGTSSFLSPAEWRFKSPEFCDNRWHSYTIMMKLTGAPSLVVNGNNSTSNNVDVPLHEVAFYIDGEKFITESNNPEIIDDIPMHEISKVSFTKLIIGACWHSQSNSFLQHFQGQLSGMTLLRGYMESESTVECMNRCHEQLSVSDIGSMAVDTAISINSGMTQMTVTASNIHDVSTIIQIIGYSNSRWYPLPGYRTIRLSTQFKCADVSVDLPVADVNIKVLVLANTHLPIDLSLDQQHDHSTSFGKYPLYLSVNRVILKVKYTHQSTSSINTAVSGLVLMASLIITDLQESDIGSILLWGKPTIQATNQRAYKINGASLVDSCAVYPLKQMLNTGTEYLGFASPGIIEDLSSQGINLSLTNSSHGLVISGRQSIYTYQFVLRRIVYFNTHLTSSFKRIFKVVCSHSTLQKSSNVLTLQLQLSSRLKLDLLKNELVNPRYNPPINEHYSYFETDLSTNDNTAPPHFQHGKSELANINIKSINNHKIDNNHHGVNLNLSNIVIVGSVMLLLAIALVIIGLLRFTRYRINRALLSNSASTSHLYQSPWVRLNSDTTAAASLPTKKSRGLFTRLVPTLNDIRVRGFGFIPVVPNSGDDSLQITVNPFIEHDKKVNMFKRFTKGVSDRKTLLGSVQKHSRLIYEDDQSLDYDDDNDDDDDDDAPVFIDEDEEQLPDEYDGNSEDFCNGRDDEFVSRTQHELLHYGDNSCFSFDDDDFIDEEQQQSGNNHNLYNVVSCSSFDSSFTTEKKNLNHVPVSTKKSWSFHDSGNINKHLLLDNHTKQQKQQAPLLPPASTTINIHQNPRYSLDNAYVK